MKKESPTTKLSILYRSAKHSLIVSAIFGFLLWFSPQIAHAGECNLKTGGKITVTNTTVSDNQSITVTVPVQNSGSDATRTSTTGSLRSFYLYVYIGRNPGDLRNVSPAKSVLVPSLAANTTSQVRVTITVPANWPTGTSYVHAYVDSYRNYVRNETNENDNFSYVYNHSTPITVVHKRSNLQTANKLVSSKTKGLLEGESFTVDIPFENIGNEETKNSINGSPRSFYVRLTLDREPGTLGSTTLVQVLTPSLAAGGKRTVRVTAKIPNDWPIGTSYLHAHIDSYQNYVKNESNESNNYSYTSGHSIPIEVARVRSNLRTQAVIKSNVTKPIEGQKITLQIPIENNGADTTRSSIGVSGGPARFYVTAYLNTRPGSLDGATTLAGVWVNSLAAGAKTTVTLPVTVPVGTRPGLYWVHALVDSYQNRVRNESNEDDNHSFTFGHSIRLDVKRARSNLRTDAPVVVSNTKPNLGNLISYKVKIKNDGAFETKTSVSGGPRTFYVDYYISRYPSSLSGARHLGRTLTLSLAAGASREVTLFAAIPSNWTKGRSYIHVHVDGYRNYINNENDETDNYSYIYGHSTAINVNNDSTPIYSSWSDLSTNAALQLSRTQLTEGEQFTITAPIRNGGTTETLNSNQQPSNFDVTFYISRLPNTLSGASSLGKVSIPSMAAKDVTNAILQATVPSGWQEGTSYIHIFVNSNNVITNDNKTGNNVSFQTQHSVPVTIRYPSSNLRVSANLAPCQTKVEAGQQICVDIPIGNFGPAGTNSSFTGNPVSHTTRLYISQFPNSLMNAVKLSDTTHSPLGPGGRITPKVYASIPSSWRSGVSYLHAVVDYGNKVKNESNEGDNYSFLQGFSAKIEVSKPRSNLRTGGSITLSKQSYEVGQQVSLSLNITNNGNAAALNAVGGSPARFTVSFYISKSPNSSLNATSAGSISTDSLAAGASRTITHSFVLPSNWHPGTSYIFAVIDSSNAIRNESNEGDNYSERYGHSGTFTVTRGLSNLITSAPLQLSKTTIRQGDYVRVVVPTKNVGSTETFNTFGGYPNGSTVYVYISKRPNSILGGTLLGSASTQSLRAGGLQEVALTVRIPTSYTAGTAYIHGFVDATDTVRNESNEGDNYSYQRSHSRTVTIQTNSGTGSTNGLSNLKCRAKVTVSKTVLGDGEAFTVVAPIHNNGTTVTANKVNGSAISFYVYAYLSRSPNNITGAYNLGGKLFQPLLGKANLDVTWTGKVPLNWPQGQSYLHVFVDGYQNRVQNESSESDNWSYQTGHSAAVRIEHLRSNLRTGGALTLDRTKVLDSDYVKVKIPIVNNGTDWTRNSSRSISQHYVYLYLSRLPGTLSGATNLGGAWINALDSNGRVTPEIQVRIPAGWAPGTSYIHAFVDGYQNRIRNESNEDDNYSYVYGHSATLTVNSRRSNLRTAGVIKTSQSVVRDYDYINVQVPIINNGNETTLTSVGGSPQTHYVYIYISKTPGSLSGATSIGGVYVESLKAGGRSTATVRVRIPANWSTGTSYIHAFVDGYQNRIRNESDETDNYSYVYGHSTTIQVIRRRSNLRTHGALKLSHTSRNDGEYLTVTVPIVNNGDDATRNAVNGSLRSFYVRVYLAPRAGDLASAVYLGQKLVGSLNAGETTTTQINVRVPINTRPARWYIHAFIDGYQNYVRNETDESDNYSYAYNHSAVLNTSQIRSNLRFSSKVLTNATTYSKGASITATLTYENAGNDETRSGVGGNPRTFYVSFWLSRHPSSLSGAARLGIASTLRPSLKPGAKGTVQISGNIPTSTTWNQGGPVYIHATVDLYRNYVTNESDESDNYSYATGHSAQVTLSGTSGTTPKWSNLTGASLIRSDKQNPYEGETITLSFPIKNAGQEVTLNRAGGTPVNFVVQFYLSTNANNLIGAYNLGGTNIYAMQAGATETAIWQGQIPAAWPPGRAYIHTVIDSSNRVGNESNKSDNVSFNTNHSIALNIGSRASNLRTQAPLIAKPSSVALGEKVNVEMTIQNNGDDITRSAYNGRATSFNVDLYISQSPNALISAVKVKTVNFAALNANSQASSISEIVIPTNWSTQTAYIHAVVDSSNNVKNESNESDNLSWQYQHSAILQLNVRRSNVRTYKSISLSATTASANSRITATVFVENNGDWTTLNSVGGFPTRHRVDLYMGRHANGLSEAIKVGSATLNALVKGQQNTGTIIFTIPSTWPTGTAYIHAVLDAGNNIGNESNKGDNNSYQRSHSTALAVGQAFSNLVTSAKITSSNGSPKAGSYIYVNAFVKNVGKAETLSGLGGTSAPSNVALYLSPVIGNVGGKLLGNFAVPSLKPNESHNATFWVQIPASWPPGSAYLHALVDSSNAVNNESSEGDNWSYHNSHSISIQVDQTGTPPPTNGTSNLRTGKAIVLNVSNPHDGQRVTATVDVFNAGTAATANQPSGTPRSFYVDLFLSKQTGTLTGATRVGRVLVQPLAGGKHAILPFQFTIPSGWKGTAYLHAFVDSYLNYIRNESDEADNYSYVAGLKHSLQFSISQKRSNLRIASQIAPSKSSLTAGEYFDVRVTVENSGNEITKSSVTGSPQTHYLYLYLNTQASTTSGSTTLGGLYLPPLKPGEKITHTFQVRVPTNWTAATAYLHAYTDGYQNRIRNESDESDNYSYRSKPNTSYSTKVTVGQKKSNLRTGGEITLDKKSASDYDYVNVTVPIWNNGADYTRSSIAGSAQSFYVYVYISTTNNTLSGATVLGSILSPPLQGGQRGLVTVRVRVPLNYTQGKAFIHAYVDSYRNRIQNESSETDNYSYVFQHSAVLTVTRKRSNLKTYAGLSLSNSAPAAGEYIDVNVPIENNGNHETLTGVGGSPQTHYVYIYIGRQPSSLSGSSNLGGLYVKSLKAGQKTIAQVLVRIPTSYSGQYYIHAYVDGYQNRIRNETNDSDNYSYSYSHSTVVYVNQKRSNPRTFDTIKLSASQVRNGDKVNVTVPILNAGSDTTRSALSGLAVGFSVRLYLGTRSNSLTGAVTLGTINVSAMAALAQLSRTIQVTVPNNANGNYWIHAFIDSGNTVRNESSETDNYSYRIGHSVKLGVNQFRSNLIPSGTLSVNTSSPREGGLLTITVPIKNNDIDTTRSAVGGNTVGFDTWVYISSSPNSLSGAALVGKHSGSSALAAGKSTTVQINGQLPGRWVGTKYIHAVVNPSGSRKTKNERHYNDNFTGQYGYSIPVFIGSSRSEMQFAAPIQLNLTSASAGTQVTTEVNIKNVGNDSTRSSSGGPVQNVKVRLYITSNAFSIQGATLLTTLTTTLAPGPNQTVKLQGTFTVPLLTQPNYFIHGYIVPPGNEDVTFNNESFRTNHSASLKILATPLSDLAYDGKLLPSSSVPFLGQSITVDVPVKNAGQAPTRKSPTGATTGFEVVVFLGPNAVNRTNAVQVGKITIASGLGGSGNLVARVPIAIPGNASTGKAYLHAVIDPTGQVGNESSRTNNESATTGNSASINITSSTQKNRSDLTFNKKLSVSTLSPYPGQNVSVNLSVENKGNDETRTTVGGTSTGFKVGLYLSQNSKSISGATRVGVGTVSGSLAASKQVLVSATATIPSNLKAGTWYLHARIDFDGQVGNESNRVNNDTWSNSYSATLNVVVSQQRSDLEFKGTIGVSSSQPFAGQSINVRATINNAGNDTTRASVNGTAVGFNVVAYIGSAADGSGKIQQIGTFTVSSALASKASVNVAINSTIPSSWSTGVAYIHLVIDPGIKVGNEGNLRNNASYNTSQSVQVTISGTTNNKRSNLKLQSKVSVSGTPYAGAFVDVSFTVENSGNDATLDTIGGKQTSFQVTIYLSDKVNSTSNATRWKDVTIAGLNSSQNKAIKETLRLDPSVKPGTYYVHVFIDERNAVGNESSRFDNLDYTQSATLVVGGIDDKDKDGVKSDKDCNDNDKTVYPGAKEICDGKDNNCDNQIDVGSNLCKAGETCVSGVCTSSCNPKCGNGFRCKNKLCVEDNCYGLGCPTGQICLKGSCTTNPCSGVKCSTGEYCYSGKCYKTCVGVTCPAGEWCKLGACVKDACAGVNCAAGQYCDGGTCKPSQCANQVCTNGRICEPSSGQCIDDPCSYITCPTGVCRGGSCYTDPCQGRCTSSQTCWNGYCVTNNCYFTGCPVGQICQNATCVQDRCYNKQCASGEFCRSGQCIKTCAAVSCSNGFVCKDGKCEKNPCSGISCQSNEVCVSGKCVTNPCTSVNCPRGQLCDYSSGKCYDNPCNFVTCPTGQVCRSGSCYKSTCAQTCPSGRVCVNGKCVENNCYYFGCGSGQMCVNGRCVSNPCQNKQCSTGEYCWQGQCIKSCASVTCPSGEKCAYGKCEKDPCSGVSCQSNEVCLNGKCVTNSCTGKTCPVGRRCDVSTGACVYDACYNVTCPSRSQYCSNGTCYAYTCTNTCPKNFVCYKGACREDNCYTYGCSSGQICWNGSCKANPCENVRCSNGEHCSNGNCVKTCVGVKCQAGEVCSQGVCSKDPCANKQCQSGEVCYQGNCQKDKCDKVNCGTGRICDQGTGQCVGDPCWTTRCGNDQICRGGSCFDSPCKPACRSGKRCVGNTCLDDNCYNNGCPAKQVCRGGFCEADLCASKQCGSGEFCRLGKCIKTCAGVTCANDQVCIDGTCEANKCAGKSCPSGEVCNEGVCVPNKCATVKCGKGRICKVLTGKCVDDPCNYVTCTTPNASCRNGTCYGDRCDPACKAGEKCRAGKCEEDNCYTNGCPNDQICLGAKCVDDKCKGKQCGAREFCRNGDCIKSCADVECKSGESCKDGKCEEDKCAGVQCQSDEYCQDGSCEKSKCGNVTCGKARVCDPATGDCIDDPCFRINCPSADVCRNGNCYKQSKPGENNGENNGENPGEAPGENVAEGGDAGGNDASTNESGGDLRFNKENSTSDASTTEQEKTDGSNVDDLPGEIPQAPEGCGCNQVQIPVVPFFFLLLGVFGFVLRRRRRIQP